MRHWKHKLSCTGSQDGAKLPLTHGPSESGSCYPYIHSATAPPHNQAGQEVSLLCTIPYTILLGRIPSVPFLDNLCLISTLLNGGGRELFGFLSYFAVYSLDILCGVLGKFKVRNFATTPNSHKCSFHLEIRVLDSPISKDPSHSLRFSVCPSTVTVSKEMCFWSLNFSRVQNVMKTYLRS